MPSHSEFDDEKQKEKMLQEWLDQNQYTRYVIVPQKVPSEGS